MIPPPHALGAPGRYVQYRNGQDSALVQAMNSTKRFVVLALPTGIGKSLIGMLLSQLRGANMLYLTSTKALQKQLTDDFSSMGLLDVRGMANYPCNLLRDQWGGGSRSTCDEGPCLDGSPCSYRLKGCTYFDAVSAAEQGRLVVSNYAFWLTRAMRNESMGQRDLLILDEAHDAPQAVSSMLRIYLDEAEWQLPRAIMDLSEWRDWAKHAAPAIQERHEGMAPGRARRKVRDLHDRVVRLSRARGDWQVERTDRGWGFEPLWPGPYTEKMLFRGIPKVVLMSATVRPQHLHYLGLQPEDYDFIEMPSPFPQANRLVTHVPTVRMNAKVGAQDLVRWVDRHDQIISGRLDRKGIAHTVSYERMRYLKDNSAFRDIMLTHDTRSKEAMVTHFKAMSAPAILVSPSVSTGLDFPYTEAEYQIISKVPYPDTRAPIMAARIEADPSYSSFLAMSELVQMAGRGVRAEDDWCETLVVDDTIKWFMMRYYELCPKWFRDSFRFAKVIPSPPPKMNGPTDPRMIVSAVAAKLLR